MPSHTGMRSRTSGRSCLGCTNCMSGIAATTWWLLGRWRLDENIAGGGFKGEENDRSIKYGLVLRTRGIAGVMRERAGPIHCRKNHSLLRIEVRRNPSWEVPAAKGCLDKRLLGPGYRCLSLLVVPTGPKAGYLTGCINSDWPCSLFRPATMSSPNSSSNTTTSTRKNPRDLTTLAEILSCLSSYQSEEAELSKSLTNLLNDREPIVGSLTRLRLLIPVLDESREEAGMLCERVGATAKTAERVGSRVRSLDEEMGRVREAGERVGMVMELKACLCFHEIVASH